MGKYDDMLYLPHHQSERHAHMPVAARAVQFAPFAALTGYEAAVEETARQTQTRSELSDDEIARLDLQMRLLQEKLSEHPTVTLTFFQSDEKKSGGAYLQYSGKVKKLDLYSRRLFFSNGDEIPLDDIYEILFP